VFYGTGSYFFSVNVSGAWTIDVVIEDEALSEDVSDADVNEEESAQYEELQEQSALDPNWTPGSMRCGDWYCVYATYGEEIVSQILQNEAFNHVDDLDRGYIIDETARIRMDLKPRVMAAVRGHILKVDGLMRQAIPDLQDNYPHPPVPVRHLNEQTVVRA